MSYVNKEKRREKKKEIEMLGLLFGFIQVS